MGKYANFFMVFWMAVAFGQPKVTVVPREEFDAIQKSFTPLDLSKAANRGFMDEKENDGSGGWTDQGPNDLRSFTFSGQGIFCGIPFRILDPAKQGGKACMVLRGQNNAAFPIQAEIPVHGKAAGLYFLHSAAWVTDTVGCYRVLYADGSETKIPIRDRHEIFNWWSIGETETVRTAWTGPNGVTDNVSLFLYAWPNPRPDLEIERLVAETPGTGAFLMLVAVTATDRGPFLPAFEKAESVTDKAGWFSLKSCDITPAPGSAPDLSGLNHKPAGRHGFLAANGDGFAFADGSPARFWGCDIVAGSAFPDHNTAERVAESVAAYGFNLVRFHHMDAPWARPDLFGLEGDSTIDNTLQLSPESLDRLDYFIAQLKKRGVYIFLDLLVHRRFFTKDLGGQEDPGLGAKGTGIYDPKLIALQKRFAEQLLTHVNPYTKKRAVDDPAVVLSEVINESSLFYVNGLREIRENTPGYHRQLMDRFSAWCAKQDVRRPEGDLAELVEGGDAQALRFVYEVQTEYFLGMRSFLRDLGYRVPIAGSNHWEKWIGDLRSNSQLDWIDTHAYWDHPQGGFSPVGTTFTNLPMVKHLPKSILTNLGCMQIDGKPLTVSEWNFVWPNEYIAEGPVLVASYAALQGWDGPIQFAYAHGYGADRMDGCFNNWNKPHFMAQNIPAALLFRRGDVDTAEDGYIQFLSDDCGQYHEAPLSGMPRGLDLIFRIASTLDPDAKPVGKSLPPETAKGFFVSSNGQLASQPDSGVFVINTLRTQGAVGFIGGKPLQTADVRIESKTPFCQIVLNSLEEDRGIADASRLLLTATARAENTGQVYGPRRKSLLQEGNAPVLMEPVEADLTVGSEKPILVIPLDHNGLRTARTVPVIRTSEGWRLSIGSEKAFWYEIQRK